MSYFLLTYNMESCGTKKPTLQAWHRHKDYTMRNPYSLRHVIFSLYIQHWHQHKDITVRTSYTRVILCVTLTPCNMAYSLLTYNMESCGIKKLTPFCHMVAAFLLLTHAYLFRYSQKQAFVMHPAHEPRTALFQLLFLSLIPCDV
jgi:uncharacterized membrane protein YbaN (DUF454 family)